MITFVALFGLFAVGVQGQNIQCYRGGKFHDPGTSWIDASCTYRCSCYSGGRYQCRSLCYNQFPDVRCGRNQVKKYKKATVPGSQCKCDKPYCDTQASVQCYRDGKYYNAGETWIDSTCTYRCSCNPGGRYQCRSLCYNQFPDVRCGRNQVKKYKKATVPGSQCKCDKPYCEAKQKQKVYCYDNNKRYSVGESYIDRACKWNCTCNQGGRVNCASVCLTYTLRCPPHQKLQYTNVPVPGSHCQCRTPKCVNNRPSVCRYRGKTYPVGQSFIDPACTGRCDCNRDGRVTCSDLCTSSIILFCRSSEVKQTKRVAVPGSNCYCDKQVCVKKQGVCRYQGSTYQTGQSAIDRACSQRCTCQQNGRMSCTDLCNFRAPVCRSDEERQIKRVSAPGTKCFCNKQVCVKKQVRCYRDGKYFAAGQKWITSSCTYRCSCGYDGVYNCQSLCPTITKTCDSHQVKRIKYTAVPGSSCQCSEPTCVDLQGVCRYQGSTYQTGQSAIDRACSQRCTCQQNGRMSCTDLCKPRASKVCRSDETKQSKRVAVPGTQCFCDTQVCVKKQVRCQRNGKYYAPGQNWITSSCNYRCSCGYDGVHTCQTLCQTKTKTCASHQVKQIKYTTVPGSSCQCSEPICVDVRPAVQYCNFGGNYYREGTSFVDPSCKWSCVCNKGGVYNCKAACEYIWKRCGVGKRKLFRYTPVKGSSVCRCKVPYCA